MENVKSVSEYLINGIHRDLFDISYIICLHKHISLLQNFARSQLTQTSPPRNASLKMDKAARAVGCSKVVNKPHKDINGKRIKYKYIMIHIFILFDKMFPKLFLVHYTGCSLNIVFFLKMF